METIYTAKLILQLDKLLEKIVPIYKIFNLGLVSYGVK